MKTQTKTLTLCAAALTAAIVAGAHGRIGQEKPNRNQEGFNCPVCDSPCINKTALQRKIRQRRIQNEGSQPFQPYGRTGQTNMRRQQRDEQNTYRQPQRQKADRFDIDGDGELSPPERAARRAYRNAMDRERDIQPNGRPDPQPPVE
jgi:hypothetical protein